MALALAKISETASTITLAWTPPSGVGGYVLYANGQVASVATANLKDGSPRREVKFSKTTPGPPFQVAAVSRSSSGLISVESGTYSGAAPPPPPPGVTYPASYYTGPLGTRNFLPSRKGAFLLTWLSMPGGYAITWDQWKVRVPQREADMGRKYDGIMISDEEAHWGDNRMQYLNDRGYIPIVANFTLNGAYGPAFTISQVASGAADAEIRKYADHWGALGFPMMVRFMHEFDDPNAWGHSAVGQEATWVAAWRRTVDIFKQRGATNVGFWWCPNEGVRRATINLSYPGDEYVDWVGTDIYNFQMVGGTGYSSPLHVGWAEFWELFNYKTDSGGNPSQHDKWGPRKPFIVGETNTVFDSNAPTKKGEWYRNVVRHANGIKAMQYCAGVSIFDVQADGFTHVDQPTSEPSVYQGWKDMVADPYWICQGA